MEIFKIEDPTPKGEALVEEEEGGGSMKETPKSNEGITPETGNANANVVSNSNLNISKSTPPENENQERKEE